MYSWQSLNGLVFVDSDMTVAQPVQIPVRSCPIPTLNIEYLLEQEFMQASASWAALALNTAHPDFPTFLLAAEGPRADVGAGLVKWKRTYICPPAQHFTPESFGYNFIGYSGQIYELAATGAYGIGSSGFIVAGRQRFARVVTSKIQNDYFAVGSGMTYADAFAIPTILGQLYYARSTLLTTGLFTDFLYNSVAGFDASTPSLSAYEGFVADAVANGWAAVAGGVLVAEDSKLTPWMGNFYVRRTRYILAI